MHRQSDDMPQGADETIAGDGREKATDQGCPCSLEMTDVSKSFVRPGAPPFLAISDINAVVEDKAGTGELITVVGPSGCGKSTLLQLVAGFDTHVPPTTGKVLFRGEEVVGPGPDRGMLFQDYGCYPHLTVLQNIAFGLELHRHTIGLTEKDIFEVAMEWLHKVKLSEEDRHKFPHELSGGMRQRVALARSLALKPACLLMDEPFSALDEPTRYEMQDLVVGLWTEIEATIMLVSHSVREAVYLGDRVWVMCSHPGTIVAEFSNLPTPTLDIPAAIRQTQADFGEAVGEVIRALDQAINMPRDQLLPVVADGHGRGALRHGST
jgi:NitT/TauT family transport system ATP-binding protein